MSPSASEFRGTDRFQPVDVLGRGAMGIVYRVWDAELGSHIALKTVPELSPEETYGLKREFRVRAGISHPNLVTLHELIAGDRQCFFTMELVDGIDFLQYVRAAVDETAEAGDGAAPLIDLSRLFAALRQLAYGLGALHGAGTIHHDVKPTNVLIERTGRLVLLDFGLAVSYATRRAAAHEGRVSGTPAYMAPELFSQVAPSPATDWYSVGAMLYEALTGAVPHQNAVSPMAERARAAPAWSAESTAPVPLKLQILITRLLDPDPLRRPSGAEVLAALDDLVEVYTLAPSAFVGRDAELALLSGNLERVRAGHSSLVQVRGPSGIGKSELISRFLDAIEPGSALILRGRCVTQESVPYKAFDAAVDDLSRDLAEHPPEVLARILPNSIGAVAQLFPVLEPFAARAAEQREEPRDPQERRERGFAGFRELIARLAAEQALVMWIDDLQWSDAESIALLTELVRGPDPPVALLLLSYRSEEREQMGWLEAVEASGAAALSMQTLPLSPLAPADAEALARSVCPPSLCSPARIAAIVAESEGSPLFIGELARSLDPKSTSAFDGDLRLAEAVVRRAGQLPLPAREMLEIVCLAGQAVKRRTVLDALGIGERGRPLVTLLEHGRFLRITSLDQEPALQAFHDRIREAMVDRLGDERRRHWHRRLADTLRSSLRPDPELLLEHYRGAEENALASHYAAEAAERAARTLAFDRAASLWAEALRLHPETPECSRFLASRAEALANAGRRQTAAETFEAAANAATDEPIRLTLQRRAAENFLRSGLIEQGLFHTRSLLSAQDIGLPRSRRAVVVSALRQRLRLEWRGLGFTLRDTPAPAETLHRFDVCWGAIIGLTVIDPSLSDSLGVMHLIEALDLGERSHLIRALGIEACREASVGGRFMRRRSRRLLAIADELLKEASDPYDHAMTEMSRAVTEYCEGHWQLAAELFEADIANFRERFTGVTWEIATCEIFAATAIARTGRFRALAARLPERIAEADARGDIHKSAGLRIGLPNLLWLVNDEVARARSEAADAMAAIPRDGMPVFHVLHAFGNAQADLYVGDAEQAWQRVQQGWRDARRSGLLFLELFQVDWRDLRARAAVALASALQSDGRAEGASRRTRARLLRRAEADARVLARRTFACGAPRADAIRAAVAQLRGDAQRAAALLEQSASGFARTDMTAHAAAAARAAAQVSRRAGRDEADAALVSEGVRVPAALAGMLVPGPWTLGA